MRAALLAPLLLATALLAGCTADDGVGGGGTSTSGTTSHSTTSGERMVHLTDDEFEDGDLTVPAGTSVKYMNTGQRPHTVTVHKAGESTDQLRLDQTLQPGQDVTYEFDSAGTYHVWCRFHGEMTSGMASTVTVN
jgi:plastocyanin